MAQKRRIFHEDHSHVAHLPKKFLSERLAEDIQSLNIASPGPMEGPLSWNGPLTASASGRVGTVPDLVEDMGAGGAEHRGRGAAANGFAGSSDCGGSGSGGDGGGRGGSLAAVALSEEQAARQRRRRRSHSNGSVGDADDEASDAEAAFGRRQLHSHSRRASVGRRGSGPYSSILPFGTSQESAGTGGTRVSSAAQWLAATSAQAKASPGKAAVVGGFAVAPPPPGTFGISSIGLASGRVRSVSEGGSSTGGAAWSGAGTTVCQDSGGYGAPRTLFHDGAVPRSPTDPPLRLRRRAPDTSPPVSVAVNGGPGGRMRMRRRMSLDDAASAGLVERPRPRAVQRVIEEESSRDGIGSAFAMRRSRRDVEFDSLVGSSTTGATTGRTHSSGDGADMQDGGSDSSISDGGSPAGRQRMQMAPPAAGGATDGIKLAGDLTHSEWFANAVELPAPLASPRGAGAAAALGGASPTSSDGGSTSGTGSVALRDNGRGSWRSRISRRVARERLASADTPMGGDVGPARARRNRSRRAPIRPAGSDGDISEGMSDGESPAHSRAGPAMRGRLSVPAGAPAGNVRPDAPDRVGAMAGFVDDSTQAGRLQPPPQSGGLSGGIHGAGVAEVDVHGDTGME